MKVSARLAQAEARAEWNAHMLPPRLTDTFRSQAPPLASPAAPTLRKSDQTSTPPRPVDHSAIWRDGRTSTIAPGRKPTPFEDSGRATPGRRWSAPAGTPTCYSRYDLARARVLFATRYEKPFDPSEHPRAQNGQFVNAGQGSIGPLAPLVPTGTKLRRMDSEETGTGMIWTIDGRPLELSEQDASDWQSITSRDWWTEGSNSILPIFWTSVPEFEAEVRRKARSYRDRMLRVEGSAAAANPIDLDKRRSARAQAALQADFAELATTVDNATFLGGLAKAPLKAGLKAITKSAESRAASVLAAEAAAETAARTRTTIAAANAERSGLAHAEELLHPPKQSPTTQAIENSADRSTAIERSLLDEAANVPDAKARAAAAEARLELRGATATNGPHHPSSHGESTHALDEVAANHSRPSVAEAENASKRPAGAGQQRSASAATSESSGPADSEPPFSLFNETHKHSQPQPKGIGPQGGRLQSHHAIQQEWALHNLPGYNPSLAPTVTLETGQGKAHTIINYCQTKRRNERIANGLGKWSSSIDDELRYIVEDFRKAGLGDDVVKQALEQNYKMLDKLGVKYTRPSGF